MARYSVNRAANLTFIFTFTFMCINYDSLRYLILITDIESKNYVHKTLIKIIT
jgi:hypothetical protein